MISISTIFLLFVLSICTGRTINDQDCPDDEIDFLTKVQNSSFVVYGKSTGKTLNEGSDSVFYVTFQVDCIFKGPPIGRLINITQAGRVEGRTYCQDLPVGRGYSIAFLEPNPLNINDTNTFIPADFVELPFEKNVTNELLIKTCGLQQILPLKSSELITDVCPIVSTDAQCIINKIHPDLTNINSPLNPILIPGGSEHGMDGIRSKSGEIQVEVDTKGGVNSINMNIILIFMGILFIRLY